MSQLERDKERDRERILSLLGCVLTNKKDIYRHEGLSYQLDLSEVPLENVLVYVASKFRNIGYVHCQENFRQALGLE